MFGNLEVRPRLSRAEVKSSTQPDGGEVSMAKREPEDPALTVLLMEQICRRENLRKALQRVRQNLAV